jgi:hypothetical protein
MTYKTTPSGEKKQKLLDWAIRLLIIVCVALGWLLVEPYVSPLIGKIKERKTTHVYKVEALTITAPFDKSHAERIATFVTEAIRTELLPSELTFQQPPDQSAAQNDNKNFISSWNKDGKYLLVLYGTSGKEMKPAYLRVWGGPAGETVTQEEALTFVNDLFSPTFLSETGNPLCREGTGIETNEPQTICTSMKTRSDGTLIGVTVKAPIALEPPPGQTPPPGMPTQNIIVIAACLVPADQAKLYPADNCL